MIGGMQRCVLCERSKGSRRGGKWVGVGSEEYVSCDRMLGQRQVKRERREN